jgi:hypothetical protein
VLTPKEMALTAAADPKDLPGSGNGQALGAAPDNSQAGGPVPQAGPIRPIGSSGPIGPPGPPAPGFGDPQGNHDDGPYGGNR